MSDDAGTSTGTWTRHFIAQRGASDDEWHRFHQRYAPQIAAWSRRARAGLSPHDYENATQEALVRVWQAMQRGCAWDAGRGTSFRAWLRSVARNALSDYLGGFLRRGKAPATSGAAAAEHSAARQVARDAEAAPRGAVVSHELAASAAEGAEEISVSLADRETIEIALARTNDRVGDPLKFTTFQLWFVRGMKVRDIAREMGRTDAARISREKYEVKQVFRHVMQELGEPDPFPDDDPTIAA